MSQEVMYVVIAMLPSSPPNLMLWKCLIKDLNEQYNIGVVRKNFIFYKVEASLIVMFVNLAQTN